MTQTAVPARGRSFRSRLSARARVVRRSELAARQEAAEQERYRLARDLAARHPGDRQGESGG